MAWPARLRYEYRFIIMLNSLKELACPDVARMRVVWLETLSTLRTFNWNSITHTLKLFTDQYRLLTPVAPLINHDIL